MRIEDQWPQFPRHDGGCIECGRASTINGREQTVIMVRQADGTFAFRHGTCDERWDQTRA